MSQVHSKYKSASDWIEEKNLPPEMAPVIREIQLDMLKMARKRVSKQSCRVRLGDTDSGDHLMSILTTLDDKIKNLKGYQKHSELIKKIVTPT